MGHRTTRICSQGVGVGGYGLWKGEVSSGVKPEVGMWQWRDAGTEAAGSQNMRDLKSSTKYLDLIV